jgi:hypothetical protein
MRSVFSSQRLENVEAVAKMLEDAGIEVKISNDRSYKGSRRSNFSYRDNVQKSEPDPQVWVIKAEDQPKARALLREAGLFQDSKRGFGTPDPGSTQSYLPLSALTPTTRQRDRRSALILRARLWLLAIIILLTLLILRGNFHF